MLTELDETLVRLERFHDAYQAQWMQENKPHGFDVQDIRLGGLMQRVKTCRARLEDYCAGRLDRLEELEAAQVSRVKDEVAFVVLNGNYALQAGYSVSKDSIAHETSDSEAAKTYVNIIAVKEGNEDNEAVKALVDVLKSDEIKDYINETYDGAVVPFEESADSDKAEAVDATADAEEDTAAEDAE